MEEKEARVDREIDRQTDRKVWAVTDKTRGGRRERCWESCTWKEPDDKEARGQGGRNHRMQEEKLLMSSLATPAGRRRKKPKKFRSS